MATARAWAICRESSKNLIASRIWVGGIWICPFYDTVLEYDYGYGPKRLTAIHPLFGSMRDFDRLVAKAHRLGIRIIMEWAVTNTSVWSPWFLESKSSRANPKADWYFWRDTPINNWTCVEGGSAWHYCPDRNQYYLGIFFREHAELNWRNPAVKAAVFHDMEFWLKKGVDGFRLDTVYMHVKDKELRSNPEVKDFSATWLLDPRDPIHKSRRIHGLKTLDAQMVVSAQKQPDAIGHGVVDDRHPRPQRLRLHDLEQHQTEARSRHELSYPAGHVPQRAYLQSGRRRAMRIEHPRRRIIGPDPDPLPGDGAGLGHLRGDGDPGRDFHGPGAHPTTAGSVAAGRGVSRGRPALPMNPKILAMTVCPTPVAARHPHPAR